MLPKIANILYATDLGENAGPALRMAYKLAEVNDAHIVILHVIEEVSAQTAIMIDSYLPERDFEDLRREGRQEAFKLMSTRLADFCKAELGGQIFPENRIEERVEEGYPAKVILNVADEIDADLVVIGAHAHTTMGELVIGSVAHKVMHRTKRPVMLVPVGE